MDRSQRAKANFLEGYNCAQSVALAFCEDFGFTKEQMARLVSGYGGLYAKQKFAFSKSASPEGLAHTDRQEHDEPR